MTNKPGKSSLLNSLPEELRKDREIVHQALKVDPYEIRYVSDELEDDSLIFAIIKEFSSCLRFSKGGKSNSDAVIEVVKSTGISLQYASQELKKTGRLF